MSGKADLLLGSSTEESSSESIELIVDKSKEQDKLEMMQNNNIYDFDLETLKDKPWLKPGADITDYFNYGFTEKTWKKYCEMQRDNRAFVEKESDKQDKFKSQDWQYQNRDKNYDDRRNYEEKRIQEDKRYYDDRRNQDERDRKYYDDRKNYDDRKFYEDMRNQDENIDYDYDKRNRQYFTEREYYDRNVNYGDRSNRNDDYYQRQGYNDRGYYRENDGYDRRRESRRRY